MKEGRSKRTLSERLHLQEAEEEEIGVVASGAQEGFWDTGLVLFVIWVLRAQNGTVTLGSKWPVS